MNIHSSPVNKSTFTPVTLAQKKELKVSIVARHLDFDVLPILGFFFKFRDCTHKIASNKKGVPVIGPPFGSDDNSLLDSKNYFY